MHNNRQARAKNSEWRWVRAVRGRQQLMCFGRAGSRESQALCCSENVKGKRRGKIKAALTPMSHKATLEPGHTYIHT